MKLGGSLTRQAEQDFTLDDNNPHIANIGHMVEDMENKMRNTLNEIYFGKTKDIVNDLRCVDWRVLLPWRAQRTLPPLPARAGPVVSSRRSVCLLPHPTPTASCLAQRAGRSAASQTRRR